MASIGQPIDRVDGRLKRRTGRAKYRGGVCGVPVRSYMPCWCKALLALV